MRQLPLSRQVVFVDWHGVLSDDPFWSSVLDDPAHQLRSRLESRLSEVFSTRAAHDWMKGLITSDEIVDGMDLRLDRRFGDDYLLRKLDQDIRRMHVNVGLLAALRGVLPIAAVVLATDNMDCFACALASARFAKARRPADTADTLTAWARAFDDYICSSDVGVLKADDPVGFFGPWLADSGLGFGDALLIDDRADNCAAFEAHGGSTVNWVLGQNDISEVGAAVRAWIRGT